MNKKEINDKMICKIREDIANIKERLSTLSLVLFIVSILVIYIGVFLIVGLTNNDIITLCLISILCFTSRLPKKLFNNYKESLIEKIEYKYNIKVYSEGFFVEENETYYILPNYWELKSKNEISNISSDGDIKIKKVKNKLYFKLKDERYERKLSKKEFLNLSMAKSNNALLKVNL